jgi:hypothetical protein
MSAPTEKSAGGCGSEGAGKPLKYTAGPRPDSKEHAVLAAPATGRSYNRFEAARELGDWCIHSTMSSIQKRGVTVARKDEAVPGRTGKPCHVMRYWLTPGERAKARTLTAVGGACDGEEA